MAVEEWDRRQLCSDGGCTGLIGPTGTCGTCGRAAANWGDERKRGLRNPTDAPPIVKDEDDIAPSAPAALGPMADWNARRLCTDGSCVGLIGANNKCKVCGKTGPAKAAKPAGSATDLERVAAEMAGTATDGDIASLGAAADDAAEDDSDEYEDDDEESDEDEGEEDDAETASDEDDDADEDDDESDDDEDEEDEDGDSDDDDGDAESDEDGAMSASAGARDLCPDGACVGIIGADGHCKICKKSRDWKETTTA